MFPSLKDDGPIEASLLLSNGNPFHDFPCYSLVPAFRDPCGSWVWRGGLHAAFENSADVPRPTPGVRGDLS